jgi:hypothetical protein
MDGLILIPATDWIWHQRIPSIRHDFILPMEQSRLQHAPRFLSLFGISSVGREQGKGVGNPRGALSARVRLLAARYSLIAGGQLRPQLGSFSACELPRHPKISIRE